MKKIVKIVNKENQFILIEIVPLDNEIIIKGIYKPKNNKSIEYVSKKINIDSDDVDIIEMIHDIAKELDKKVNSINQLFSLFKILDEIEIVEK